MIAPSLFLTYEDAYDAVEFDPPTGEYGVNWAVYEAPDGPTARRAWLSNAPVRGARLLSEQEARWAFEEAAAEWPPSGTVVVERGGAEYVEPAVRS